MLIYEFHYEYTGVKYDCGAKFSFTDTDSLVFEIETDDVYEDSFEYKGFRDYPKDSRFYDPLNKKKILKLYDEVRGKIINEVVGLK